MNAEKIYEAMAACHIWGSDSLPDEYCREVRAYLGTRKILDAYNTLKRMVLVYPHNADLVREEPLGRNVHVILMTPPGLLIRFNAEEAFLIRWFEAIVFYLLDDTHTLKVQQACARDLVPIFEATRALGKL